MTSRLLVLGLVLLVVGCNGENDPPGTDGPAAVQLVDGQAVCDSCASVRIVLSGPGTVNVSEATLVTSNLARTAIAARIVLARESGSSGDVLVVNAYFDAGIDEGEFDLWLDPLNDGDVARVVPRALRVTRARPGVGDLAVVRVWVQSTGVDRDGRFVLRTLAGCEAGACDPMPVEAYLAAPRRLLPGAYTFQLDEVASNCTVGGAPNPSTVTLERGRVTSLTYQVLCTETTTPAWVRVTNVTSGASLDHEYRLTCSLFACQPFPFAANRDTVLRVVPGELTIGIGEVAPNCTLAGASPVSVTATAGDTSTVMLAIECRLVPGLNVTVRTSGRNIDPEIQVGVCVGDYDYRCTYQRATSSDPITFHGLEPGDYTVRLHDLEENCSTNGPRSQTVALSGASADVVFDVTCLADGIVRVSAVTTGTNQDVSYVVAYPAGCDGWYYYDCETVTLSAAGSVDISVAPGTRTFELLDVRFNCVVTGPSNPASVTVIEDDVVELRFEVACQ